MRTLLLSGLIVLTACASEDSQIDPARSTLSADRVAGIVADGADGSVIRVKLVDAEGVPFVGAIVAVHVSGENNELAPLAATDANGETTTRLTTTTAEKKLVTVDGIEPTLTIAFSPGPAHSLAFRVEPSTVEVASVLSPAVEVVVQDEFGNLVTEATSTIDIALGDTPSSASLSGTTSQLPVDGVARFDDLSVSAVGTGYSLVASSSLPIDPTTSAPFDVVAEAPNATTSTLTLTPSPAVADGSPAVTVTATIRGASSVPLADVPVSLQMSGANNFILRAGGMTDHLGRFSTKIGTTTPETKTITLEAGAATVTGTVTFTEASCVPLLPGPPVRIQGTAVRGMFVGDFDSDGHPDVALTEDPASVTSTGSTLAIVRNVGTAGQLPPVRLPAAGQSWSITGGDLDLDDDIDLVVVSPQDSTLRIFLGDGYGDFAMPLVTSIAGRPLAIAISHVDADTVPDLVLRTEADITILSGLGNGTFQPSLSYSLGFSQSIGVGALALADLTGDGRDDIVTADSNAHFTILIRDASGAFQAPITTFSYHDGGPLNIEDFDEDGDLDVVLVEDSITLLQNDGAGTFSSRGLGAGYRAAISGDFDLDGHLDLVADWNVSRPSGVRLMRGNGDGTFIDGPLVPLTGFGVLAKADVNGDGRPDVISAGGPLLDVIRTSSNGELVAPVVQGRPNQYRPLAGDFNGDGNLDVIGSDFNTGSPIIWLNSGAATFTAGPVPPNAAGGSTPRAIGDFDNDGNLDLVQEGTTIRWLRGNGNGSLQSPILSSGTSANGAVTGHFDADTNLDLAAFQSGSIVIQRGNGDGTFVQGPSFSLPAQAAQLLSRDVDGDGDDDILLAMQANPSLLIFRNAGNGTFQQGTAFGPPAFYGSTVTTADFDADGNVDLAMPLDGGTGTQGVLAFMKGLGNASFAPYVLFSTGLPVPYWADATDIDSDGALDVIMMGRTLAYLRGNGDGTFGAPLHYPGDAIEAVGGDFDGDGRRDVITTPERGYAFVRNVGCVSP